MTLVSTQRTPFTWGRGGSRISPDDLRARQAMQNAQPDFSPVASPWQGLGRVAQNLLGAWELRDIDRSQAQQQATAAADRTAQIAALLGEGNADLAPGLSSADPVVSALAGDVFKSRQPKTPQPTELQRNFDWLTGLGRTEEANNLIGRNTQNLQWITADNGDGTKSLIPVGPNGPIQAGTTPQPMPQAAAPVAAPSPRPEGMSDDQIWAQAHEAVRNGADVNEVFRRLQSWGLNP